MSTLGQLFALSGQNMPKPYAEGLATVLSNEREQTAGQTDLLRLAELQRAQETQARVREYYRLHPEEALGLQGQGQPQSILGGGGMPQAPAPMTQQPLMPGQPPGVPQVVPGGQDLSRFAQVSPQGGGPIPPDVMAQTMPTVTPPMQSTLGAPGPQQGQAPQQNPLLDLMRSNPDAALQVQGRLMKIQEARLTKMLAEAEYAGRWLQSVKTPEDYAPARADLARVLPEYAATLPPTYSKEALQPYIDRAFDVKSKATLGIQEIQARTEEGRLGLAQRKAAETIPNYTGDPKVDARIYTKMQKAGVPPGTMPPQNIVDEALQEQEGSAVRVAERTGAAQEAQKPLGETATLRFNTLTQAEDTVKKLSTEFTPEERRKFVGMGGMAMGAEKLKQLAADAGMGKADPKFARFAALVALAKAEAFSTAGKALTKTEEGVVYGYIPTGKEYSAEEFEQKLTLAQERIPSMLDRELKLATTPRSELPGMRARGELGASTSPQATGRTGTQAPPTSQGSTGTGGQGPATFDRADFLKWRQGAGKSGNPTQADVEAYFQARGLKRR